MSLTTRNIGLKNIAVTVPVRRGTIIPDIQIKGGNGSSVTLILSDSSAKAIYTQLAKIFNTEGKK